MKFVFTSQKPALSQYDKAQKGMESLFQRRDIGFLQLTQRASLWKESSKLGSEIRSKFSDLLVVGIGGSSLGATVIAEVFQKPNSTHRLHFCDNVDPLEFERLIASLNLEKTACLGVSKSGNTAETLMNLDFINQIYFEKGLSLQDHFFALTETRANPLYNLALQWKRPGLEFPSDVGGRFSVLSPVGMLPAAFLGLDLESFRQGALKAQNNKTLIVEATAQFLESFQREEWISLFWFYSSWMKNFGRWTQQLWAESLSKKINRQSMTAPRVSTPLPSIGTCDQHSILQQIVEGPFDKFVLFITFRSCEQSGIKLANSIFPQQQPPHHGKTLGDLLKAEALATSRSLTQVGVSNAIMEVETLSPESLGELFMFWQLVVAVLGECLDLNAFDQPGVELGKKLAREILQS